MSPKHCRVTLKDPNGLIHRVEVDAESVYEAAVLAVRAMKRSDWIEAVGPAARLQIEVFEAPVTHFLHIMQLTRWLDAGGRSPEEVAKKQRLKALLRQ